MTNLDLVGRNGNRSSWTAALGPRLEFAFRDVDLTITRLMVILTFSTGVVDAASYLGLHKVFTANMTGNIVFIGLGLAGNSDLPVLRSLIALVGFLAGATLGGRFQRSAAASVRCPIRTVRLFGFVAVLICVLAVSAAIWKPGDRGLDALTAVFGLAMGAQAAAARRLAVTDVSTVVVTSTLASLAADSRFGGRNTNRQIRRLAAAGAMCVGAVVGALLLRVQLAVPLAVAALIAVSVTCVLYVLSRTEATGEATDTATTS